MTPLERIVIGSLAVITAGFIVVYFGNRLGRAASSTASKAVQSVSDAVSLTDKNIAYTTINQIGDLTDDGRDNDSWDLGEIYRNQIGANP